ncbi:hypothetical protein NLJ89_g8754 [Agrocybe chaxingu]|uniref:Cytochrome P450 n=1 Tax=Agrocybe chaxingu TaxID=84603 RepID=A0A9W8MSH0_9AGAR|nr:hypothetical protein NLJ89_g8754 [Agrocybe chaxingu]
MSVYRTSRITFDEGIFNSLGERHRLQRKMLNPVFSIAHMRTMGMQTAPTTFLSLPDGVEITVNVFYELIGQSGLGFSFDTLTEDSEPHPYGVTSKKLLPQRGSSPVARHLMGPLIDLFDNHRRLGRFLVDRIPSKDVADMKDIVDILHKTSVEIYEGKKAAIEAGDEALKDQVGHGKDIIMKANIFASEEDRLSEKELLGQVTSLTFAATDTTSSALTRTLYLLAAHNDVQERLRKEIRDARKEHDDQDLDYDPLVALPYLDAICRETLRLARADNILPLGTPVKGVDGTEMESLEVPNGTDVIISILASNRNPELHMGPGCVRVEIRTLVEPSSGCFGKRPCTSYLFAFDDLPWRWPILHWIQVLPT